MEIQVINISDSDRKLLSDFYGQDLGNEIDFSRLMPLVEKIGNQRRGNYMSQCSRLEAEIAYQFQDLSKVKIQNVYKAVVEFVKWYNTQK